MSLRIEQRVEGRDNGSWDWSVWLEGPDRELDNVEVVEYVLHPTLDDPVQTTSERENRFLVEGRSWREFAISAFLVTQDRLRQRLSHRLRFGAGTGTASRPSLFLSASLSDSHWEDALRKPLQRHGYDIFTASEAPAGVPWTTALESHILRADGVVGIFSDRPSPGTERNLIRASVSDVPIIPVRVGESATVPRSMHGIPTVGIGGPGEVDAAATEIVGRVRSAHAARSEMRSAGRLEGQGDLAQAQHSLERAIHHQAHASGDDSPAVAHLLTDLASIAWRRSDDARAIAHWQEALNIYRHGPGADDPGAEVDAMIERASGAWDRRDFRESETWLRRAMTAARETLGSDHFLVAALASIVRWMDRRPD